MKNSQKQKKARWALWFCLVPFWDLVPVLTDSRHSVLVDFTYLAVRMFLTFVGAWFVYRAVKSLSRPAVLVGVAALTAVSLLAVVDPHLAVLAFAAATLSTLFIANVISGARSAAVCVAPVVIIVGQLPVWGSSLLTFFGVALLSATGVLCARYKARDVILAPGVALAGYPTLGVSMILPSYNAGPRLLSTIKDAHQEMGRLGVTYEIIVVDDGSVDGSCDFDPDVLCVTLLSKENGGKGTAIATGIGASTGALVGFLDADGDIHPRFFAAAVEQAMINDEPRVVVGSKVLEGSQVEGTTLLRRITSWGFRSLMRSLVKTGVRDSQVGCKVFPGTALRSLSGTLRETAYLCDVEILAYLHGAGASIMSTPVTINPRTSTTVTTRATLKMLSGVFALAAVDFSSARPLPRDLP